MGLSDIISWIKGAYDFAKKAWNVSKTAIGYAKKAWDTYIKWKKNEVELSQIMIDGVTFIVSELGGILSKVLGGRRKAIALGVSLIVANNCVKSAFDESRQIMERASDVFLWLAATNFTYQEEMACRTLVTAFKNVEDYLESCVDSNDHMYKDTGQLVGDTVQVIERFCVDHEYQKQLDTCGCGCNCTQRNEPMLLRMGLVDYDDITAQWRNHVKPSLEEVCEASEAIKKCERTSCTTGEEGQAENVLARTVDSFCSRHSTWEAIGPAAAVPTAVPANAIPNSPRKETTTKAGTASLKAAFYYLSLIASMVI